MKKPDRNILLIGGGRKPPMAMQFFLERARDLGSAQILLVGWASSEAQENFESIREELTQADYSEKGFILHTTASPPVSAREKTNLRKVLAKATAVFFIGGDQSQLMDGLLDPEIKEWFLEAYQGGKVFGGTSAGTAIMSSQMIYGHETLDRVDHSLVWIREGLGILPSTILDQHFFRRGRHNRLLGAVSKHPCHLAIGVDEDASIIVTNERHAQVIGGQIMIVDASRGEPFAMTILNCGDLFDLKERRR